MIKPKIKRILDEKDKSIYWLADKANLSYPTVYNLVENKTSSAHFKTLEQIMTALNIESFDEILELVSEEDQTPSS